MVGRVGKQCRERWNNHLRPHIKKDIWTEDEEGWLIQEADLKEKIKKVKGDRRELTVLQDYIIKKYFSNGSTSTNSNFGTTTTTANPSNASTPLSNDDDSTPFFSFDHAMMNWIS
ncbi:transcriptional activator Myb-like [Olea europaea var. sylvestris]|uniref:transcriptional activator Myb-like n=1 Tax=Olea europaea var. sylvestris TaxID=158386 RepID=UPI000C1CDC4D|nr:transcriptional activator Myb-like [Olea europaea var. sylvestris]